MKISCSQQNKAKSEVDSRCEKIVSNPKIGKKKICKGQIAKITNIMDVKST